MSKTDACHVQLNGVVADLVSEVSYKVKQCGLRGWEALPLLRGAKDGVPADARQV